MVVGYLADRFRKSYIMAVFYLLIGASVFLLANPHSPLSLRAFALIFGFSMGADYMLIPLVTSECFGTASLGKLLALIIMGYSIGQWGGHGWWAECLTRGTVTTWRGESSRLVVSPGQRLFMPYHSSEPAQNEHRSSERRRRV